MSISPEARARYRETAQRKMREKAARDAERRSMSADYRVVAGRIRMELLHIAESAERAEGAMRDLIAGGDERLLDAAALNLHAFYTGVEQLLEVIASRVDGSLRDGRTLYRDLLAQMASEIADLRPPVLGPELRRALDPHCGFRHVVRHAYALELDPARVANLVDGLPMLVARLERELTAFADLLDDRAV